MEQSIKTHLNLVAAVVDHMKVRFHICNAIDSLVLRGLAPCFADRMTAEI